MKVLDLLEYSDNDTRDRVEKTFKRYNQVTREAMRNVTRLRLQRGKRRALSNDEHADSRVPCSLKTAVPEHIAELEIPSHGVIAAVLSRHKPDLVMLRDSAREVFTLAMNGTGIPVVDDNVLVRSDIDCLTGDLEGAKVYAEKLLAEIDRFDLVQWLFMELKVNVLGRYTYLEHDYASEEGGARIELYWGVIGLVATQLAVAVEDLTVVVLAHELAHAYTHLGFDTNNIRWSNRGFSHSEVDLKEGLAQYYCRLALEHLEEVIPNCITVFDRLLEKQPHTYHAHLPWFERATPESVRHALVMLRHNEVISLAQFNKALFAP